MQELYKQILEKILKNHPDTVAVIVHGSSLNGNLSDYSDIDINVFISGQRKDPIENEIIEWQNKKILVNFNFNNYKEVLGIIQKEEKAEQILIYYTSLTKIRIIYDKIRFIPKLKKASELRFKAFNYQNSKLMTVKFNILIDCFFKIKKYYAKKNYSKVIPASRLIASQSIRIIQFFNKMKPEEMYNSIRLNYDAIFNLKKFPNNFIEDFETCMGLKENLTFEEIYSSAIRLTRETIQFLNKQNLKNIKNNEFLTLLEQTNKYIK